MNRTVWIKDIVNNKWLYAMMIPVIAYYVIFHYLPMYGTIIAFQNYSPIRGIMDSPWVGLHHFESFFNSYYFWRILKNTVLISFFTLLFEFPAPVLLALLVNELRSGKYKRIVQTVSYMPYFISTVVICGLIHDFSSSNGLINAAYTYLFGGDSQSLLQRSELFRPIYVLSEIWQRVGWESIIYIAALSTINPAQYEAATIDGAGRWKQMIHITLPGLMPTIVIMFILRVGNLLNVGYEKIILLYNPLTYETADVISTFVYRKGLLEANWGYSAAVGLFNSFFSLILLISANYVSRKVNKNSLW